MPGTVFITGANAGIGLAATTLFLSRGFSVAATARDPSSSPDLQALLSAHPSALLVLPMDLLSLASVESAVAAALARFPRVDALVNNAGAAQYGPLELVPAAAVERQFAANLFGPVHLTKLFLAHFHATSSSGSQDDDGRPRRVPTIVNVSSGGAHFGFPLASLYHASKAALDILTESLVYELSALSSPVAAKLVVPHGVVTGTTFARNLLAMGPLLTQANADADGNDVIDPRARADYAALLARQMHKFQAMADDPAAAAALTPAADVAERIFEAATDGDASRLRYFVGPDAAGDGAPALKLRFAGPAFEGEAFDEVDRRYVERVRKVFE